LHWDDLVDVSFTDNKAQAMPKKIPIKLLILKEKV
jgi:hypothetical protein